MTLNFAEIAESCNNCTIVACDYSPKKSIPCAVFFLFSVAANSLIDLRIGCDYVESPIGAIIAQQSLKS